ncbi:hypothetical protein GCM10009860_07000 [Microbacterium mitrae]
MLANGGEGITQVFCRGIAELGLRKPNLVSCGAHTLVNGDHGRLSAPAQFGVSRLLFFLLSATTFAPKSCHGSIIRIPPPTCLSFGSAVSERAV